MDAQRIIRTYYGIAATTTLAQALIWGVNTLFLLSVGFDIFDVMLINAAYTVAQVVFEVPTGVVADTVGRRVSYLLAVGTILVSTLLYVGFGLAGYGLWPFAAASALLGLGYTFYTGAVDAWMVDALHSVGYEGRLEPIFARYGITFGIFMLIGTTLGGVLGQVDLWIPYVTRAVVLVPAFLLGLLVMRDLGFKARALTLGSFGRETRRIAREGVTYGLSDRVVRFIMFASLVQGVFFMYGFYSWQKYFLDLLGSELVWVTGVIAAFVGLTQILGNMLVGRITAAGPGPRPDPHGLRSRHDGDGHRRRAHPAVLGRRSAVPRLVYRVRHLRAGQAGLAQRAHPVGAARDHHLARRAVRRRRLHRRPGRPRLALADDLDPVRLAGRRPGAGRERPASRRGAQGGEGEPGGQARRHAGERACARGGDPGLLRPRGSGHVRRRATSRPPPATSASPERRSGRGGGRRVRLRLRRLFLFLLRPPGRKQLMTKPNRPSTPMAISAFCRPLSRASWLNWTNFCAIGAGSFLPLR